MINHNKKDGNLSTPKHSHTPLAAETLFAYTESPHFVLPKAGKRYGMNRDRIEDHDLPDISLSTDLGKYEAESEFTENFSNEKNSIDPLRTEGKAADSRRVSFNLNATETHLIDGVKQMTQTEKHLVWYNKQEIELIKSRNNQTIELMEMGRSDPELNDHCYRGLECKLQGFGELLTKHRMRSKAAVLVGQSRQEMKQKPDPITLATA